MKAFFIPMSFGHLNLALSGVVAECQNSNECQIRNIGLLLCQSHPNY